MTHTPGPWMEQRDKFGMITGMIYEKHQTLDAPAIHKQAVAEAWTEANVTLIAAAPDLLEAAKVALDTMESIMLKNADRSRTVQILRSAIAKAEPKP